jgi:fused signal recognition particle receptor
MLIEKIRNGLSRTSNSIRDAFLSTGIFKDKNFEKSLPILEEILLSADVGITATTQIINRLRDAKKTNPDTNNTIRLLTNVLIELLKAPENKQKEITPPYTVLTVGVNGTGKTTTIAKLAKKYKDDGHRVLLVASDTYRPAGVEQLKVWGDTIDVDVLKSQIGQDPASVAFDAIESSMAKGYTSIFIDTAGRLHTRKNLMKELKKIKDVLRKKRKDLPQDIFLILDATTGQNGLVQAKIFKEVLDITGIILTKIDGTAKGGIIFAIIMELGIPVKYVGTGENTDDIIIFDPELFVKYLLEGISLR